MQPFPEEANRRIISQIANLHFYPTTKSTMNLKNSGITKGFHITGNTVVDAAKYIANIAERPKGYDINWDSKKIVLLTVHRRENWEGEPFKNMQWNY